LDDNCAPDLDAREESLLGGKGVASGDGTRDDDLEGFVVVTAVAKCDAVR
jgi:hypothetical protein